MKNFIEAYRMFSSIKSSVLGDSYRFCWIPIKNGNGVYASLEFYDDELPKIDPNKVEILIF